MPECDCADDRTVADDDVLWHRIPPRHLIYDENRGTVRASSAAFDDNPKGGGMSVVIARQAQEQGRGPESILLDHKGFSVKSFTAELARKLRQKIVREPINGEPAHAEVFGRKTDSIRKALARESKWVVCSYDPLALDSLLTRHKNDGGLIQKIRQCFESRIEWQ